MPTITEKAAQRYAAAVIEVLAGDFPALKDNALGRIIPRELAQQAEAPSHMFELIVTYTREWRLVPDQTGRDRWRVQVRCHIDRPTAADGKREQRINAALRAIELED
jgi:hypothetical protein